MTDFYRKLGAKVRRIREQAGLSQERLAEKLGLPRPAISQIEKGGRSISADELAKLSDVFHIPVERLLDLQKQTDVILPDAREIDSGGASRKRKTQLRINVPQENLTKFKEVLLYILDKVGAKTNIGETVIYKLLYFMDFDYYEKYEEQLIGAQYQKNRYGPTPVEFAKIVDRMIREKELERVRSKYFDYPQTKYLPLRKPNLTKLSAAELDTIEDVLKRLSDMNASQISEYSHNDVPWRTTPDGGLIEYEAVFYRTTPYSVREYPNDVP